MICPTNFALTCFDQRLFFLNAFQIRLWTAIRVLEVWSTRMFYKEFRRTMAGQAAAFATAFHQSFFRPCQDAACTLAGALHPETCIHAAWAG